MTAVGPAIPKYGRGAHAAMARPYRPPAFARPAPTEAMRVTDIVIVGLLLLAIVAIFTVSPAMLSVAKIHYVTTGGNFYEKFHPASYFAFLAFGLLLVRNGDPIDGLDLDAGRDTKVFHAGTQQVDGKTVTAGGRVLTVCALGKDFAAARENAYAAIRKLHFDGGFYRRDIGHRAIGRGI